MLIRLDPSIDGLSIPFFSLGKRVHSISRTWSRHTSLDPSGTPEWANQARRVSRGDDIIINRDPDGMEVIEKMERGELPQTDSPEALTPSSSISLDEKRRLEEEREAAAERGEEVDGVTERRNSLERQPGGEGHAITQEEEHQRPHVAPTKSKANEYDDAENSPIPDRDQIPGDETQWREGNHLIIERKVGDGEDVSSSEFCLPDSFILTVSDSVPLLFRWKWK